MGRYKLGPQGAYYDPNDSGPDQASPDQIQAIQQTQAQSPTGGYQPPTGGINAGPVGTPMPTGPKFPGMPSPHTGPWMPTIQPNPELDAFYEQQKAQGKSFPEIMDAWQAAHPQTPHMLGDLIPGFQDPNVANHGRMAPFVPSYNDFYNRAYQQLIPKQSVLTAPTSPLYQSASLGLQK